MLFNHSNTVDSSDDENPVFHFTVDVDAEYVRERLLERGVRGLAEDVEYVVEHVWDYILEEDLESVFDSVADEMESDGLDEEEIADWENWNPTHRIFDEKEFYLAVELAPDLLWDPPAKRVACGLRVKDSGVGKALLDGAEAYPHLRLGIDDDGWVNVHWDDEPYSCLPFARLVEERFGKKFGSEISVPVFGSYFDVPVYLGEIEGIRSALRGVRDGEVDGYALDERLVAELDDLLGVVGSVGGGEGPTFMFTSQHIPWEKDESNGTDLYEALAPSESSDYDEDIPF